MTKTKQPGEAFTGSKPVTPESKDNTMRNALIGGTVLALGAAGIFLWNTAKNTGETNTPDPSPTPVIEASPTATPVPGTNDSEEQAPNLYPLPAGQCWNQNKGGQFFIDELTKYNKDFCIVPTPVATTSATPTK